MNTGNPSQPVVQPKGLEKLPQECLQRIVENGGGRAAMACMATCSAWRLALTDEWTWRALHCADFGDKAIRRHSYQLSYSALAQCRSNWAHGDVTRTAVTASAHDRWVTAIDISPGGSKVLSGGMDSIVKLWERDSGASLHCLRGHTSPVSAVCMPTEHHAVSSSRDGTVKLWDVQTGTCLSTFVMEGSRQWPNCVVAWVTQPSLARASRQTNIHAGAFATDKARPTAAAASAGGLSAVHIAFGSLAGDLVVWDARAPGSPAMCFHGMGEAGLGVYAVSVHGDRLAASTTTGLVCLYDLRAAKPLFQIADHDSAVTCLALRADMLICGDLEGSVYLWDLASQEQEHYSLGGGATSRVQLYGKYCHRDWVSGVAEVQGTLVSCCRAGEMKLATIKPGHAMQYMQQQHGSGYGQACSGDACLGCATAGLLPDRGSSRGLDTCDAWRQGSEHLGVSGLQVYATWQLASPADSPGPAEQPGSLASGPRQARDVNQVLGLAADVSGIVAACKDSSIRSYWFSKDGGTLAFEA